MSALCLIDDKHVPLYRILWVSQLPHFCGSNECQQEGHYEIRLDQGDSLWVESVPQRDAVLQALEVWCSGGGPGPDEDTA